MKNTIIIAISAVLIWGLSGCSVSRNLVTNGTYSKEILSKRHTEFRSVWAEEKDERLIVSGKIYLKGMIGSVSLSSVQIELIDRNGDVMDIVTVSPYPRLLHNHSGRRTARFSAGFDSVPPKGTTIRLQNNNS